MPARLQVTVILKHMFRPEEFEIEPELKEALDADITSECTKLGKIEKVSQHACVPRTGVLSGTKTACQGAHSAGWQIEEGDSLFACECWGLDESYASASGQPAD